jgi:hypothetical protein
MAADGYGGDPFDEQLSFGEWIGAPIVRVLEQVDRRTGSHLAGWWIAKRIYWLRIAPRLGAVVAGIGQQDSIRPSQLVVAELALLAEKRPGNESRA